MSTDPVAPRPQPVVDAGRLGGLVSAAVVTVSSVYFLVQAGVNPASITALGVAAQGAVTAVVALLTYLAPLLHAKRAAALVTPLADPRDDDMNQLVRYGKHAARGPADARPAVPGPYERGGFLLPASTAGIGQSGDPRPVRAEPQLRDELERDRDHIRRTYAHVEDDLEQWIHQDLNPEESPRMTATSYIRHPRKSTPGYTARQVARAMGMPIDTATGRGTVGAIIELGGDYNDADLKEHFGALGIPVPKVTPVVLPGGARQSDGPDGADAEVSLDIQVAGEVAPGAELRVYFAANTDAGFAGAVKQAVADGVDGISISWGGPESSWSKSSITAFSKNIAAARAAGIPVFCAAGDQGSDDGTSGNVTDYPASDPNAVACGGTRLTIGPDGKRESEVVWDDNDTSSATGGGVSKAFPGRDVPDVAANADPATGYIVDVDGEQMVVGGTSAVAPLLLGGYLLTLEATGGKKYDFANMVATNPQICFDVTQGDNGGFSAGPGRDETTGWGDVDFGKLISKLVDPIPDPVPPTPPAPAPTPTPTPDAPPTSLKELLDRILRRKSSAKEDVRAAEEAEQWLATLS